MEVRRGEGQVKSRVNERSWSLKEKISGKEKELQIEKDKENLRVERK